MTRTYLSFSADHLFLPTFPTLRSSDLSVANTAAAFFVCHKKLMVERWELRAAFKSRFDFFDLDHCQFLTMPDRSEEHTSELQSRQYLLCIFLLVKKN